MDINLTLNIDEINAVLQTLGNLPTSSGAYPLLLKIKDQAEVQLPKQEEPTE
jgi:hypothetical protein